jgi:hypothetical protein
MSPSIFATHDLEEHREKAWMASNSVGWSNDILHEDRPPNRIFSHDGVFWQPDGDGNDSTRDSGYGTMSGTASVHAALSLPGVREEMLDMLINDKSLRTSAEKALKSVETNVFVKTFQGMLRTFAQEFRVEAEQQEFKGAAYVFWFYAAYAATGARQYWGGTEESSAMTEMLAQLPERKI